MSSRWGYVTDWYIDPARTHGGSDRNDGLTSSTPIESIDEWRRRVSGTVYTGNGPIIHALSGSTNADDGLFYGFTTPDLTTYVRVLGTPVTTGLSGTVSSWQPYSGNTRAQFADTAIPTSWTASGGISGSSGSRFVRKISSSGARHYAPLLTDMGSKTAMVGIVVDWDETDSVTLQTAETTFANADSYEVVAMPSWPSARSITGNVQLQCFDVLGLVPPTDRQSVGLGGALRYRLCGFPQNFVLSSGMQSPTFYSCVFCAPNPAGVSTTGSVLLVNCAISGSTIFQTQFGFLDWNGKTNVVATAALDFVHSFNAGSLGNIRSFDNTSPCISVRHNSAVKMVGTLVGSGNSGALVDCNSGGIFYGASNISATTSAAHPYLINGVSHDTPGSETSGDAIYA